MALSLISRFLWRRGSRCQSLRPCKWSGRALLIRLLRNLRHFRRNSILMTCHYTDLVTASDWLKAIFPLDTTNQKHYQIWVITRHQYPISANFCVLFRLRLHLEGKPEVAPRNSGCFLRLLIRPGKKTRRPKRSKL